MPRLPRLFAPEIPAHVTVRGNNRQDIFTSDSDRAYFLRCLGEAAEAHELAVHAYVLMSNHVHLLATGRRQESLGKSLQSVGRRYVAYFNTRYGRTGTLWEGRYRSTLVEADGHLLACHRYIDLNPVRAGLARSPRDYPWSSHGHYARGRHDALVTAHPVVVAMGPDEATRRTAYLAMFDQPVDPATLAAIRHCSRHSWAFGSPEFCRSLGDEGLRRPLPLPRGWVKGRKRNKHLNEGV